MSLPPEYTATTYLARTPLGDIRLRVGLRDDRLRVMVGGRPWALITAANPSGQILAPDANAARNRELLATLRALDDCDTYSAVGVGDDSDHFEPSFLVVGLPLSAALDLAKRFGQRALLAPDDRGLPALIDCSTAT